jgi:hypothetical protein
MELEEIEVIIGKDGQVQIMVRGVQGTKCLELTRELEEALGGDILSRVMTPEALENNLPSDQNIDEDQQLKNRH